MGILGKKSPYKQGLRLRKILCIRRTTITLYETEKYHTKDLYKACPFCQRKNLVQESTCQKDESETGRLQKKKDKKEKKGPSNDKLSEGTSQYANTWLDLHIIFNCSCFTSLGCVLPRPWGRHLALMFTRGRRRFFVGLFSSCSI